MEAGLPEDCQNQDNFVQWVRFPHDCVVLKRVIFPTGAAGLLLAFDASVMAAQIRTRAIKSGFTERPQDDALVCTMPSPSFFKAGVLADLLGGEVFRIRRNQLTAPPWTVDSADRFQTKQRDAGDRFIGERAYSQESALQRQPVVEEKDYVQWVKFANDSAVLKRVIFPTGSAGLLLTFGEGVAAAQIRARAVETGFTERPHDDAVFCKPPSPSYLNAGILADLLGGEVFRIRREELTAPPWTVDHSDQFQSGLREIGLNFLGERVYRRVSGARLKRVIDAEGHFRHVAESESLAPVEFLRAVSDTQLPQIAAGLLKMAERGSIGKDELISVARFACEPVTGPPRLDLVSAQESLRREFLRQIVASVVEDNGSREAYHRAMKLAEHAAEAVREPASFQGFAPTPGLLVFLRRLAPSTGDVDFSGNSRLEVAAPALRSEGRSTYQLLDLTGATQGGAAERAANALARRSDGGTSTLLVSGAADADAATAVRRTVGIAYAFQAVAEISQEVATGSHGNLPITAFIVGERRPKPEDSLPEAALRTFRVDVWSDLDKLHTELLRTRRRIAEWHRSIAEDTGGEAEYRENARQRPYVSLSRLSPPVTMIPRSLEGATAKALRRVAESFQRQGDVDVAVAASLGVPAPELPDVLSAEQVDALAMSELAAERGRGFLLADQTGIGKGRALAAIARRHLRRGGKVLYLTENAEINIPDVWRDFVAVGADKESRPCILASRPVRLGPPGLNGEGSFHKTESAASRKTIYESGAWPQGRNLVITNYSQFNGPETRASRRWVNSAPDDTTLLILDEAHNAVNRNSNTGQAIRGMISRVGHSHVIYATATPMRDPSGADLYRPLLPTASYGNTRSILETVALGGETAQECFTTMLAEDGVFLRRDHCLSNIEFQVRLPDDARIAHYQDMMNLFAPLSELMLDAALRVGTLVGRGHALHYQQMLNQGVDPRAARARTNALFQHSAMAGGPLANLARLTINAIKVDQVVEETLNEIREGRKPQITFHSTHGSLFSERVTNGSQDTRIPLTFRDQAKRVSEQIFRVLINGERQDARTLDPEVAAASRDILQQIELLPEQLPASPLDAVIEGLEAAGLTVGEISGRSLAYRRGSIIRRTDTDRRKTVRDYNDGVIDVLVFNRAGATGGSYHASPDFIDQRPRSLIEMETPLDIIKYIQAQGRSNRFGQVARPRIVSVMTGLIPEMRILQQRNRKLRAMGASIDGNRSHPLLLDDVPDFLNKVGDLATRHVLRTHPDLARRLGFASIAEEAADEDFGRGNLTLTDSGSASSGSTSLANRTLTRSLVLSAAEQTELIDLIRIEFEGLVEELESRNANPLKPKEFPGTIDIKSRMLFSGVDDGRDERDPSAFLAPLYIATGTHHIKEEPIGSEELLQMVNRSLVTDGAEGFASFVSRVETLIPSAVSHLIRPGTRVEDAMAHPEGQPSNFQMRLSRLRRLTQLLDGIKPGRVLQMDEGDGSRDNSLRTIVKLTKPQSQHVMFPQAYKIRTVTPGHSAPETISLNQLIRYPVDSIRFLPGLELGQNDRHLRTFAKQMTYERRYPVQILSGNLLEAITVGRRHRLGWMSIYREVTGQLQRGIVITGKKVDFDYIPLNIPSLDVVESAIDLLRQDTTQRSFTLIFVSEDDLLFRIVFYKDDSDGLLKFVVSQLDKFIRFINSQHSDFLEPVQSICQRGESPGERRQLLNQLRALQPLIDQGEMTIRTDGSYRGLITQAVADMRRKMAGQTLLNA